MTSLVLRAPAKINWTLEVLGKRPDGYHEVRTVLQTVHPSDAVTLTESDELTLSVWGATRGFRRASRDAPEGNLVYRAAELLRERAGHRGGAGIQLSKQVPVAAGLGGGSSDAAAVLRGLRALWKLGIRDDELASIAAELGSDVPFFLHGGTALGSGRGGILEPLPDVARRYLVLAWPQPGGPPPDKTARMYAALRPEHYSDGARTEGLAGRLRAGEPVRDEDLQNVFEAVLPEVDLEAAGLFERAATLGLGRPHLCGSGPAFFFLVEREGDAYRAGAEVAGNLQVRQQVTTTLSAADCAALAGRL